VSVARLRISVAAMVGVALASTGLLLAQRAGSASSIDRRPISVTEDILDQWCIEEYGGAFRASNVSGNDPFQWRCWGRSNGIVSEQPIPMDAVCSSMDGAGLLPRVIEGPTGWECSPDP